ncbi:unnamed protein product [Trichobilharzia regenti]|nr:unnamed protein product [Trichobilharzia regenti]
MNIKDDVVSLLTEARLKCEAGDYKESLNLCEKAYASDPSPNILRKIERLQKLVIDEATKENQSPVISTESNSPVKVSIKRKIERIENYLKENEISSDDDGAHGREESSDKKAGSKVTGELIQVADGFNVPKLLYDKLYDYQKSGIKWLWGLHQKNSGGILADDMGLGKTVQVIYLFICVNGAAAHWPWHFTSNQVGYGFELLPSSITNPTTIGLAHFLLHRISSGLSLGCIPTEFFMYKACCFSL